MKRQIVLISLPPQTQFELEMRDPGIVRKFIIGMRKPIIEQPDIQFEEVPTVLVEVNPDAFSRKRRFVVVSGPQMIDGSHFEYRDSALSRNGSVFHLFEDVRNL